MNSEALKVTDTTCRACLNLNATKKVFSVHKQTALQYSCMLNTCTTVQVEEEDKLPKNICTKCSKMLINFYRFRTTVIENDIKLRKVIEAGQENTNFKLDNVLLAPDSQQTNKSNKDAVTLPLENHGPNLMNCNVELMPEEIENVDFKSEVIDEMELKYVTDSGSSSENEIEDGTKNSKKKSKNIRLHRCDICGKILSCKSNLNQHIRKHTGERPYGCNICDKKFFKAEHALIHKRIHTGERPHKCLICARRFIQYATLKAHLRVHSGERPYQCSVCGKAFSQSSSLVYHRRIHSGETPFVCKICNKGFKNVGNLNIHTRFHKNERPYFCHICDKRFVTSSHLNVHIKRHNGEKPHKCVVCGKAFVRSEHLKGHLVIHSGQKPHACKLCPKKYTQASHLNRHMKKHKAEAIEGS